MGEASRDWLFGPPEPSSVVDAPPPDVPGPVVRQRRTAVNLVWDGVLGLGVLAFFLLTPGLFRVSLMQAGYLGFAVTGFALSLRAGVPNLAVGAVASATWMATGYLVSQHHLSMIEAAVIAVAAATLAGLVLGLLVVALSVPAWAVTLGAVPLLEAFAAWSRGSINPDAGFDLGISYYEAFGACVVVTAGGALWLLGVHRSPGRYAAVGGMAGSCLLAGLTGVFVLSITKTAAPVAAFDMYLTIAALGAVLLGGESLLGRGGGVLGVVLAVLILPGVQGLLLLHDAGEWAGEAASGGAIVLGLGVHRLIDLGAAYTGRVRLPLRRRAGTASSSEEPATANAADPSTR